MPEMITPKTILKIFSKSSCSFFFSICTILYLTLFLITKQPGLSLVKAIRAVDSQPGNPKPHHVLHQVAIVRRHLYYEAFITQCQSIADGVFILPTIFQNSHWEGTEIGVVLCKKLFHVSVIDYLHKLALLASLDHKRVVFIDTIQLFFIQIATRGRRTWDSAGNGCAGNSYQSSRIPGETSPVICSD